MKLTQFTLQPKRALLTLALLLFSTVGAMAQSERVSFERSSMTGAEILTEIERQANYKFAYSPSVYDSNTRHTVTTSPTEVSKVLDGLFAGRNVKYTVQGRLIVLTVKGTAAEIVPQPKRQYLTNDMSRTPAVQTPRPEAVVTPPEPITIEKRIERQFPESYSAYIPAESYLHDYKALPTFALKTNLLYGGLALAPNLSFEFGVSPKSTIALSGSYTWWGREKNKVEDYKQWVHALFNAEYRWWLCERFNGHFFGAHLLYGRYNVSGHDVPLLFDKEYRYDGHAYGAGVSYGYNWAFAKRWGLEFNVGLGYAYMKYDRFGCQTCDTNRESKTKHYFGPTRLGISLVFLIK